jgi:hypothetical protein
VVHPAGDQTATAASDPLIRYEARLLDPSTAMRPRGGEAPASTVYRGNTLLVTASSRGEAQAIIEQLNGIAGTLNLRRSGPDVFVEIEGERDAEGRTSAGEAAAHNRLARLLALADEAGVPLVVPVRFESSVDGPAQAVDVWALLLAFRDQNAPERSRAVGLDHLMFAAATISGNPFTRGMSIVGNPFTRGMATVTGNPFTRGMASGVDEYLAGGSGGHGPVSVVLAPPLPRKDLCRPHVVVLDTGVGRHPWFDAEPVARQLRLNNGDPIGLDVDDPSVARTDPEGAGAVADPLTGMLASHAGHGTFIAGLLRQSCPNASITALRIMDGDGVVAEQELTQAITALAVHLEQKPRSVDAIVLSLGYYAEADDAGYTAGLKDLLIALGARGVVTFAAAGNDCTDRRSYPAAFAGSSDGQLPVMAVAALNPDQSVALFSNDAQWVNGEALGANIVSTAPILASGAWSAGTSLRGPNGERRGTIDPDQFSSGFATWSGTSFAAPVLAGKYLAKLVEAGCPEDLKERRSLIPFRTAVEGVDSS